MRRRNPHRCSCAGSAFSINPRPTAFVLYIFLILNFSTLYLKAIFATRGESVRRNFKANTRVRRASSEKFFDRCFDRYRDNRAARLANISRGIRGESNFAEISPDNADEISFTRCNMCAPVRRDPNASKKGRVNRDPDRGQVVQPLLWSAPYRLCGTMLRLGLKRLLSGSS